MITFKTLFEQEKSYFGDAKEEDFVKGIYIAYDAPELDDLPGFNIEFKPHVTVMYSSNMVSIDSLLPILATAPKLVEVKPIAFDVFDDFRVLLVDAPELFQLHDQLVLAGLQYTHEQYKPHITLSTDLAYDFDHLLSKTFVLTSLKAQPHL